MKTLLKPFQILWQGQQGLSVHGHQSKEIASTLGSISPITQIVLNKSFVGWDKQSVPNTSSYQFKLFLVGHNAYAF